MKCEVLFPSVRFVSCLDFIQLFRVYKNPDISLARICVCLNAKEKNMC